MRTSAPSVMLSAIAALVLCHPLPAQQQQGPLDRGTTAEVRFARADAASAAGVSHTWEYARRVRRGTVLHVHVWGDFSELNRRLVPTVSISDPDAGADLSRTTRTEAYTDESITATKTFDRPGRVLITVSSGAEAVGRGYALRVEDPSTFRSSTRGGHFAAGYGTTTLATGDAGSEARGEGFSIRAGAGVSRVLTVFVEGGTAGMSPAGTGTDTAVAFSYRLTHAELGARLYLLGSWSRLRPFAQGAWGVRWIELSDRPILAKGMTFSPGGGAELFLRPGLAVEAGVRRSFGAVTLWKRTDGKWQDIPPGRDLDARATRAHLQLVVHR